MPCKKHFFIDVVYYYYLLLLALALDRPPSKAKRFGCSRFEMNTSQYARNEDFFQEIFVF
jgi:hypothetical protein